MYIYKVGYLSDFDKNENKTYLSHDKKMNEEEFNGIVLDAYSKANEILEEEHEHWKNNLLNIKKDIYGGLKYKQVISDMHPFVIDILISKYNFKKIESHLSFMPSDDLHDLTDDDIDNIYDPPLIKIYDRLNKIDKRKKNLKKILKE